MATSGIGMFYKELQKCVICKEPTYKGKQAKYCSSCAVDKRIERQKKRAKLKKKLSTVKKIKEIHT